MKRKTIRGILGPIILFRAYWKHATLAQEALKNSYFLGTEETRRQAWFDTRFEERYTNRILRLAEKKGLKLR